MTVKIKEITIEKFLKFTDMAGDTQECIFWQKGTNNLGYGTVRQDNTKVYAHRISYTYHYGEIPEGLEVMHSCDNPACINKNHLSVGTHKQNMHQSIARKRFVFQPKGPKHPSAKFTATQVRTIKKQKNKYTYKQLAEMYDCTRSTIYNIVKGKTYSNVK